MSNTRTGALLHALIAGGTSGLGKELAKRLEGEYGVTVLGRNDPGGLSFQRLDLASSSLPQEMDSLLRRIPHVDLLIYAAGFYQEGTIGQLTDGELDTMTRVGFLAPALLVQRILRKQESLGGLIVITSSSQWTPRKLEPVYTGVKAGLGMLAESLSLDPRIQKTLVAAPSGMRTPFWDGHGKDTREMLDPAWVADEIMALYREPYAYRFVKILRGPPRVEIERTR